MSAKLLAFHSCLAQPACFHDRQNAAVEQNPTWIASPGLGVLVGWFGGWLAEQAARSAQRLSTCHGPTRFHHHALQPTCLSFLGSADDSELDGLGIWLVSLAQDTLAALPSVILWMSMHC